MNRWMLAGLLLAAGLGPVRAQATPDASGQAMPPASADAPAAAPAQESEGPKILLMRGLDKITGKPTDIIAPIGKPVHFATLTIVARYCYSTPPSQPPETTAFVQIEDHRPDQPARQVFSGWMYASSPGLNGLQHPLYDVWVISCKSSAPGTAPATVASAPPEKVPSPDSSDKEGVTPPPADAGE